MRLSRVGGVSAVAASIAVSVYAGQAPDPAAKAASILAEARKALGGDDKIAAIKTMEIKGTARRGAGEVNIEGDLSVAIELPDKYLRKESIILGGGGQGVDIVEGLNGNEAWDDMKFGGGVNFGDGGDFQGGRGNRGGFPAGRGAAPGAPATADGRGAEDPERAKQTALLARQTEVARVLLAILLTTDRPVKWTGTAVSPQATAEVLEMDAPDGTPVRLLIDSKTYTPLLLTWTGIPQDRIAALAGRAGFGRRGRGGFRGGFPGGGRQGQQQTNTAAQADALAQPTALRMFLSEYKAVNGVKLPHLLVRGAGDQVTEEWVVKNYRLNPNLQADTFKK